MNIPEAIKRLEKILLITTQKEGMPDYDALRLGIEALKRLQNDRETSQPTAWYPLPGETEEVK